MSYQDKKVIYAMQHNVTKRIYVGVTNVASYRIKKHLNKLLNGTHTNIELQSDFDKYGFDFSFYQIEEDVPEDIAFERERYWMCVLGSNREETGYNLSTSERPYNVADFPKVTIQCMRGKLVDLVED